MANKYALDCEMVASRNKSILARVSIVNQFGNVVLDSFVKPISPVTDYRTFWSGVTPEDMAQGVEYELIRIRVFRIIQGSILIGHSLHFDLGVLKLDHPTNMRRDLAKYRPLQDLMGRPQSLKTLAREYLFREIQSEYGHDSVEDARASMDLYNLFSKEWELSVRGYDSESFPNKPLPEKNNTCLSNFCCYFLVIFPLFILFIILTSPK